MRTKRQRLGDDLFDHQMSILGKERWEVLNGNLYWQFDNTITLNQYNDFKRWAIPYIKKVLKVNRLKAEFIFRDFYSNYGLRRKG